MTTRRTARSLLVMLVASATIVGLAPLQAAHADGDETLAEPDITLASGSGVVTAGTGLRTQPGLLEFTVPSGASVEQVLLYWEGVQFEGDPPDPTIVVDGEEITGTLIGGPLFFFPDFDVNPPKQVFSASYRADITDLGLVTAGGNALSVSGLTNSRANDGAGIMVIYDDGSGDATIGLRDGLDLAYAGFPPPRKSMVPQTFTFAPADFDRSAELTIMVGTVQFRNNSVVVKVDGTTVMTLVNQLASKEGPEWDNLVMEVEIPAGATSVTVEPRSDGSDPASLVWVSAVLSISACGGLSSTPAVSHGSAYGLDAKILATRPLNQVGKVATVAPGSPASATSGAASATVPMLVSAGAVTTKSDSSLDPSTSTASATISNISLLNGAVKATTVKAVSTSTASTDDASYSSDGSMIQGLTVGGAPVTITPNGSVAVKILGITVAELRIFEQSGTNSTVGPTSTATHSVNMLRLVVLKSVLGLPAGTEVIIGHAQSDATSPTINCVQ